MGVNIGRFAEQHLEPRSYALLEDSGSLILYIYSGLRVSAFPAAACTSQWEQRFRLSSLAQ
jgi:hypothetical protein